MKNYEVYEKEILELTNAGKDVALHRGMLVDCDSICCHECDFGTPCGINIINWLYAEHVEKPKIDKRTKMFFDAIETGWVARDSNGSLFVYADISKPVKGSTIWIISVVGRCIPLSPHVLPFLTLDFIKWEDDEPWSVEDILKLKVEE